MERGKGGMRQPLRGGTRGRGASATSGTAREGPGDRSQVAAWGSGSSTCNFVGAGKIGGPRRFPNEAKTPRKGPRLHDANIFFIRPSVLGGRSKSEGHPPSFPRLTLRLDDEQLTDQVLHDVLDLFAEWVRVEGEGRRSLW